MFRTVGNILLGIRCRSVGLGIGINTEYGKVASLTRPHPVVGLSTKLSHRLRYSKDQSKVGKVAVNSSIILVAFIESSDVYM